MPFHGRLVAISKRNPGRLRILGAFSLRLDSEGSIGHFFSDAGVVPDAVVPIDFGGTGLSATPTLLGLDRDGVTGRSWIGKLDADKENDVLRYIATSCPDCRLE